jgi:hypothetical protein
MSVIAQGAKSIGLVRRARSPDRACSVDYARGLGKIGTVGSTYFLEIGKVLLERAGPVGAGRRGS